MCAISHVGGLTSRHATSGRRTGSLEESRKIMQ